MPIRGEYYVTCEDGTLIICAAGNDTKYWLRNKRGVFQLYAEKANCRRQLPLPFDHNIKRALFEEYLQSIGKKALQAAGEFACGRREILQFCLNGGQPALELVKDCPALAYLIANKILPSISPEILLSDAIREILAEKRTDVLARVSWRTEKWIIRLLRKIPASQCSVEMFADIHLILMSEDSAKIKVISHLRVLHRFVVKLLADRELSPYLTHSFYEAISSMPTDQSDWPPDFEVFDLKEELLMAISNGFHVSPLKSLVDLKSLHARFIRWLRAMVNYETIKEIVFPPPPFPKKVIKKNAGVEFGIFPLENGKALWQEGVAMHNCIAGYAEQILCAKGLVYAYHVRLPNEPDASLMIRSFGFDWHLKELKAKHNHDPSIYVELWVENWLASQSSPASAETGSCFHEISVNSLN